MTAASPGRPPLPIEEKRVRLAGGPTVEPRTLAYVRRLSGVHNLSLGEVVDYLVHNHEYAYMNIEHWKSMKENERNER